MHANALKRPSDDHLVTVCLVPFGSWQGHPMGPETYGPEEGAAIVAYFDATYGSAGKPMPVDYGHASLYTSDAPAAGWVWSLEVAEHPDEQGNPVPGVWGKVEWTDRARSGIESREYSGAISPVIDVNFPDPVSGQTVPIGLFNAALTNQPFMLDKMPQAMAANSAILTLNDRYIYTRFTNQGGSMDPKQMLSDAAQALGLPATATGEEVLGLVKKLVEFVGMLPGAPASPAGLPAAEPGMMAEMQAQAANSKTLTEVAQLLGVASADVLAEVGKIRTANSAAPNRAEFDALQKRLAERDADDLVAANERKISPDDRAFWRTRAVNNLADTRAILEKMPDVIPSNGQNPTRTPNSTDPPDEFTLSIRRMLGTDKIHNQKKEA